VLLGGLALSASALASKPDKVGASEQARAAGKPTAHARAHTARPKGQAETKAHGKLEQQAPSPAHSESGAERAPGNFKSAVADLGERYRHGTLKKAEVEKQLEALEKTRAERRRQHREALQERWGDRLAQSAAREELGHHEQRMARLHRLSLLAEVERTGKAKGELSARIEKVIVRENARHERKMSQFQDPPGKSPPDSAANAKTAAAEAAARAPAQENGAEK
jgi:hypothetical protein